MAPGAYYLSRETFVITVPERYWSDTELSVRAFVILHLVLSVMIPASGAEAFSGYSSRNAAFEESRQALELAIKPFSGSIVDSIVIEGNTHTRNWTIIREMVTSQGEILDENMLYRDHSYLRGLGYFSEVDIRVEETSVGHCNVVVKVSERPGLFMRYPYPIVNYDLEKGVSYGFRWKVKNFQGTGQELFFGFEKRRGREHGGAVSWSVPWLGRYRMRMSVGGYSYRRLAEPEKDDFIKSRNGGNFSFGLPLTRSLLRQIWITPNISLENRESRLSTDGIDNNGGEYYTQLYLQTGLTLSYDSRDNLISPFSGGFIGASVRRFTSVDGMKQQYSLMSVASHLFIPFGRIGSLIFAVDADNRDGSVPFFYRLGIGGESDLRGFHADDIRRTARMIGTIQWRRNFFGPRVFDIPWVGKFDISINGVAFVDNGALMDSFEELGTTRYHTTGGFGVEIISPLHDMIRLETAFSDSGSPVFYVATGNRF
jgi:outer membrane protein assembly factor BamA